MATNSSDAFKKRRKAMEDKLRSNARKCSKPRKRSTGRRLKPSSTRISVCYQKPSACSGRPNTMQRSVGYTERFVTIHEESDEVFFEPCRVTTLQRLLLRRSPLSWTLTTRRILSRSTLWTFKM